MSPPYTCTSDIEVPLSCGGRGDLSSSAGELLSKLPPDRPLGSSRGISPPNNCFLGSLG